MRRFPMPPVSLASPVLLAPARLLLLAAALITGSAALDAQAGLLGRYFTASVPPPVGAGGDFQRVDPTIDFAWTLDAPDGTPITPDDLYSERWNGWVHVDTEGDWTFTVTSNDGARLWVDEQLVVDDWSVHSTHQQAGTLTLSPAGWYPVQLEHFNQGGTAVLRLDYAGPNQPPVTIPGDHLCSSSQCIGSPTISIDAGQDQFLAPPATSLSLQARVSGVKVSEVPSHVAIQWSQLYGPPATILDDDRLQATLVPGGAG